MSRQSIEAVLQDTLAIQLTHLSSPPGQMAAKFKDNTLK